MSRKEKTIFSICALAGAAVLAAQPADGGVLGMLALPFALAAGGLRTLSLSGGLGNGAAIVLYGMLCLSPLLLKRKGGWRKEDALLVLAVGVLFLVLYGLINPSRIPVILRNEVGETILCGTVYSVLISWGVLKLLRASDHVRQENVYRALRIFLMICGAELVAVGLGQGFRDFLGKFDAVKSANTWPGQNLIPTYIFLFLSFAVTAVEYVLDGAVLLLGVELLRELERDAYSQGCLNAANRMALWCKRALTVITLSNLALNLGQVVLARWLHNIDCTLRIPVLSLALAFGALALVRLLGQGKALKEDNDLFI